MVALDQVRQTVKDYYQNRPLVAVFIGGTQGIGDYTVTSLAQQYSAGPPLRVYIVGRSKPRADGVLAKCRDACPHGTFTFVAASDVASIKDVDRVSQEIVQIEKDKDKPRIDLLFQTQGQLNFGARQETDEGLDRSMSLLYYSRIRFISNFLPLLNASSNPHVVSVYAAGMEAKLYKDDLSLRLPQHYGFANCRSHSVHMKTLSFEHIARENTRLALTHIYPGFVIGPGMYDPSFPPWFKVVRTVMTPLAKLLTLTPDEAGIRMLYGATDVFGSTESQTKTASTDGRGGAYAIGRLGQSLRLNDSLDGLRKEGFDMVVWEHTMAAFKAIGDCGRFVE